MNKTMFEMAAQLLHMTTEEAQRHYKEIPEENACYFWNPIRGGASVIISETGEKLGATSSVSFERHLAAFKAGKRN